MKNSFTYYNDTEFLPHDPAFDHGRYDQANNFIDRNLCLIEHFRDNDHGSMYPLTDLESQVAGFPSHRHQ